ncbi:hypothetical protein [Kitasatospora sp. NPDC094016]|uniref:hypothetical protein n=1 Tax=Kitasatospora sp. NPDC094016 TaxID=3154986 RepID=UPI003318553D
MIAIILTIVIPTLLVAISLWRLPAAIRSGRAARSLCITIAALGLAMGVTAVRDPLQDLVTGLPILTRHLLGLTSIAFLIDYLYAVHGRGLRGRLRPSFRLAASAAATMTGLFFFALPRDANVNPDDMLSPHFGEPAVITYMMIFYSYLGFSMALATRIFWSTRRALPRGLARTGVLSLATGCALGTMYVAERVYILSFDIDDARLAQLNVLGDLTVAASILLIITGLCLPPLRGLARYLQDQHTLWVLHPLLGQVIDTFPNLQFGERRSRVRELFVWGDRTLDTAYSAFAVRDAFLNLGVSGGQDATTDAIKARNALHRHAAHNLLADAAVPDAPVPGSRELRAPSRDIRWAKNVARAYNKTSK